MRFICLITASLAMSGCAATVDLMNAAAGVGNVKTTQSNYDNATTVTVSPSWLSPGDGKWSAVPYKLGGRWTSAAPDLVALVLSYDKNTKYSGGNLYTNITGMDVRINGDETRFEVSGLTRLDNSSYSDAAGISTSSRNDIIVPYDYLMQMMTADDVRMRIHSGDGYADAVFHPETQTGGQQLAKKYFRKFIAEIDKHR